MSQARRHRLAMWVTSLFSSLTAVLAFVMPAVLAEGPSGADLAAAAPNAPSPIAQPFSPLDPGPEAIPYEALSDVPAVPYVADPKQGVPHEAYRAATRETKGMVNEIGENAELNTPPAAHQAWARYSAAMQERASIELAGRTAGLTTNIANTGVE